MSDKVVPMIVVHGGAGDIPDSRVQGKIDGVLEAARRGRSILEKGGTAMDACEAAIKYMELDENFNAGLGSVLTTAGKVEMEASVMDGSNLNCGCITLLNDIKHPISAAKIVMEKTFHNFLGAEGANDFLKKNGNETIERCKPEDLVTEWAKKALKDTNIVKTERTEIGDTVGAVALDNKGNLAAATSTGGMSGKLPGRIGDTPIIGGGTYADNRSAAVSATGHGEAIMKYCVAVRTCDQVEQGSHPKVAATKVLNEMTTRLGKTAGLIAVTKDGRYAAEHTSPRMAWACAFTHTLNIEYGIEQDEKKVSTT